MDTTGQKATKNLSFLSGYKDEHLEKLILSLVNYDRHTATVNFFLWSIHPVSGVRWSDLEETIEHGSVERHRQACDLAIKALYTFDNVKPIIDKYRVPPEDILWD